MDGDAPRKYKKRKWPFPTFSRFHDSVQRRVILLYIYTIYIPLGVVAKVRSWDLCAKSVLENGVLGPQKGQISPRGPTMVGRGVCSPRGLASESGPRICYKHQFGIYIGKMALRHLTNRTTHFHLNPVGVTIHVWNM